MGDDAARERDHAQEIEIDRLAPFIHRNGKEVLGWRPAGISNANVDTTEGAGNCGNELLDGFHLCNIDRLGEDLHPMPRTDLVCRREQLFLGAREHGDVSAFSGERLSGGASHTVARSADDGHLIFQSQFHSVPLTRSRSAYY